ncbi:glutathione S-transferase family protein [Polyangium aurulentum]|uniref:glutathione S-transferase family protein n=1 Tax=Polyangium aurulentum TaxID=2567896 RepID=UPI00146CFF11|nr:glutathione S-transferase family protein [Polyangium aurulentum]UQA58026.1 glutathione S-transferase family protein [Polyangium aurulentum]
MITVYKTIPSWDLPDLSPFVIKLETWLRMAHIPYRTEVADMRKAPKGKVPFISDGDRLIADSSAIIEHLEAKHGDRLEDARFSPAERAVARAMKSLFEADLYFVIAYLRWWNDEDFAIYRPALARLAEASGVPKLVAPALLAYMRRQTRQQLVAQGTARHAREEVYAMGRAHVVAVSDFLGDKRFFMGDEPSTLDATAYGMLAGILWGPWDNPVRACAASRANLVGFCERMRERYWSGGPVS